MINRKSPSRKDYVRQGIDPDMVDERRKLVDETEEKLKQVRSNSELTTEQKAAIIAEIRKNHEESIRLIKSK